MFFLPAAELCQKILSDGEPKKFPIRQHADGDEPGQRDRQHDGDAPGGVQIFQPAPVAVENDKGEACEQSEGGRNRPFDQNAKAECDPEGSGNADHILALAAKQIDPGECALRQDDHGQQDGIGFGDPRLQAEREGSGKQNGRQKRGIAPEDRTRRPPGEQHCGNDAEKRGDPVGPDLCEVGQGERRDRKGLQPVNADGFFVARLILEADVDEIAGFQHLLGGLGEARLVTVGDRERGKTGEVKRKAESDKKSGCHGPLTGKPAQPRSDGLINFAKRFVHDRSPCLARFIA